jgi:hypothetical protein
MESWLQLAPLWNVHHSAASVAWLHSECHTPGELQAGLHVQQALNLPQSRPPVHPGYWGQTCNGHQLETGCCQWLRLQRISTGMVGARGVLS